VRGRAGGPDAVVQAVIDAARAALDRRDGLRPGVRALIPPSRLLAEAAVPDGDRRAEIASSTASTGGRGARCAASSRRSVPPPTGWPALRCRSGSLRSRASELRRVRGSRARGQDQLTAIDAIADSELWSTVIALSL
jgi:hypothetical protein